MSKPLGMCMWFRILKSVDEKAIVHIPRDKKSYTYFFSEYLNPSPDLVRLRTRSVCLFSVLQDQFPLWDKPRTGTGEALILSTRTPLELWHGWRSGYESLINPLSVMADGPQITPGIDRNQNTCLNSFTDGSKWVHREG